MKQFSQYIKYLIIGGVIALITLLFPKTIHFGFLYVLGQKWRHTDLIAEFDFPVLRNESEKTCKVATAQWEGMVQAVATTIPEHSTFKCQKV